MPILALEQCTAFHLVRSNPNQLAPRPAGKCGRTLGQLFGSTYYVCDSKIGRRFLVDAGAQLSVIPPSPAVCRCPNRGFVLPAANCCPTTAFGLRCPSLDIGPSRLFPSIFMVADVPTALLGADF
ncbi:unnamed protein product [Dibothriocephalus latus]|uniref:Peptidase A2 domain-containing protein n=1 Tax=Dibothriocephalus latus TaxID=60516 RepID=A0A3P6SCX1_DIBLA|nr:unnamed protein product [Dibothriocephalus latus]